VTKLSNTSMVVTLERLRAFGGFSTSMSTNTSLQ
jgi:hypothetical protein